MNKYSNWIEIAVRSTIFILLPAYLLLFLIYRLLFNADLDVYWLALLSIWWLTVDTFAERYKHQDAEERIERFAGLEKRLDAERWEILDRRQNELVIRPTFDFPFHIVFKDMVKVTHQNGRITISGPVHYVEAFSNEINGEEDLPKKRHWPVMKTGLTIFLFALPVLLEAGLFWEMKVFYHNAFASAETQIEMPADQLAGNSIENHNNGGYTAENEQYIFYVENEDELYRTDKQFEERTDLMDEAAGFGVQDLNIVGEWLYYNEYDALKRMRFDGTYKEVVYDLSYLQQVQIQDNWIYFINEDDDNNLYRMDLNGNQIERLLDEHVTDLAVMDDELLVTYTNNKSRPTDRLDLDGSSQSRLLDQDTQKLMKWKEDYYYLDIEGKLYRTRLEEQHKSELIVNQKISNYTVTEQGIFYSIYSTDKLYKSGKATTENGVYLTDFEGKHQEHLYKSSGVIELLKAGDSVLMKSAGGYVNSRVRRFDIVNHEVEVLE